MAEPVPTALIEALQAQLSVITTANGYNTDIGALVQPFAMQRDESARPSIAIGSRSGQLSLRDEGGNVSAKARRMELVIEAAMDADLADEERVAQLMLEDIEQALERDTRTAPFSVRGVVFTTWSILPRSSGGSAVVLQLIGSANYKRP